MLFIETLQTGKSPGSTVFANEFCMEDTSDSFQAYFSMLSGIPLLRHWVGDRIFNELAAADFSIKLKPWEASLRVLEDDIRFDRMSGLKTVIQKMTVELLNKKWRTCAAMIQDGFTGALYGDCYDGLHLYSATHTTGSNLGTAAFSRTALDAAILAMRSQVDPTTNDDLLIEPTHLWYHPSLEARVSDVLDKQYVIDITGTSVESNRQYKILQKMPIRGFTSAAANYWGLLAADPGDPIKPFIWRHVPSMDDFTAMDSPQDEARFMRREVRFGIEMWANGAPGFCQYIWGSNGTT
jgi:phage major head subunit gpT-like protein